jgi:hypothetical protein
MISRHALEVAGQILAEIADEALGWVLAPAILGGLLLLMYGVMKKLGYIRVGGASGQARRFGFQFRYTKKPGQAGRLEWTAEPPAHLAGDAGEGAGPQEQRAQAGTGDEAAPANTAPVGPEPAAIADAWRTQDLDPRRAFVSRPDQSRRFIVRLRCWVLAGTLFAGAVFCGVLALQGTPLFWAAALVLAGGPAVAYARICPSEFD